MNFNRTYPNWALSGGYEHLNITEVQSHGETVEELIDNAEIYIQTWHGGEGPSWSAGDLPTKDYVALEEEFQSFLIGMQDMEGA
jgi:poly-beta-hydroxyalkanoate depolymerase